VQEKVIARLTAVETSSKSFHLRLEYAASYVAASDPLSLLSADLHNRKEKFVVANLMTSSSKMFASLLE